ncbi:MAG: FAD-dependent oxidoreductase [Gemmatimonadota bacterium]
MSESQLSPAGPDFLRGISFDRVPDGGSLLGHVGGAPALLVRRGANYYAIGAVCSHQGGPLGEGLVVGESIRCPRHHSCFSLKTGEPVRAPALEPIPCWNVRRRLDQLYVTGRRSPEPPVEIESGWRPQALRSVVIVGAGAAGTAAADALRQEGFDGSITLIGDERDAPYDRPTLSKQFLAGKAREEDLSLHQPSFYRDRKIHLVLGAPATRLDLPGRAVGCADGSFYSYDALLLATGATPVPLTTPGSNLPHVCYLRSLADARALVVQAGRARHAVVLGASFIGLEVAASLRARGVAVHVVAPESSPLDRTLGPPLSAHLRALHESHGVRFHLGRQAARIDATDVTLDDGRRLSADLVVAGVGVRPNTDLAARAGIAVDRGILVDQRLESSAPRVFAAGDAARWPDLATGSRIRIEHWVVAERQGRAAARSMLGQTGPYAAVPFFWTQHYDTVVSYVGHAERWNRIEIARDLHDRQWVVEFVSEGRIVAVATIGRDRDSLKAEAALERDLRAKLWKRAGYSPLEAG